MEDNLNAVGDLIDATGLSDCEYRHLSQIYCVEPGWAQKFVRAIDVRAVQAPEETMARVTDDGVPINTFTRRPLYEIVGDVAVHEIVGPVFKGNSKFTDANSIQIRRGLRHATARDDVKGNLLVVDSPGGTVAGIEELALDVRAAANQKPLHAHVDDLAASAAYWMIAQPGVHITANRMAEVGSIGVYAVVEDLSGMAEQQGIVVHVVSTGSLKGAGVPGTEITEEYLAEVQERVDAINGFFVASVAEGRSMSRGDVKKVADGRVFGAAEAKKIGLVDSIGTMDDSFARMLKRTERRGATRPRATRATLAIVDAERTT